MANALTGKVAVITGGATGIGKAVATRLAAGGVKVLIAGRDHVRGKTSAYDLAKQGYEVKFLRTDVRIENAISGLFDQAIDLYGGLDYLFNNAGIEGVLGPISENSEEVVDDVLSINIKGVFLCMKQVIPFFTRQGGGVIVNTSSFVGTVLPFPDAVLLGATQAGVISMTQSVAAGFASENIRVCAVCPWLTDTPMVDRLTHHQAEAKSRLAGMNPSGRAATPRGRCQCGSGHVRRRPELPVGRRRPGRPRRRHPEDPADVGVIRSGILAWRQNVPFRGQSPEHVLSFLVMSFSRGTGPARRDPWSANRHVPPACLGAGCRTGPSTPM